MGLEKIRRLGDLSLYEHSSAIAKAAVPSCLPLIGQLHGLILEFRNKYGKGRAIAAPQVGVRKRIICWNTGQAITIINPVLSDLSPAMMEIWDDCMSFPGLLVKVRRHRSCTLDFMDSDWNPVRWKLSGDESELIQHEVDHLNGILATQRAVDGKSFRIDQFLQPK